MIVNLDVCPTTVADYLIITDHLGKMWRDSSVPTEVLVSGWFYRTMGLIAPAPVERPMNDFQQLGCFRRSAGHPDSLRCCNQTWPAHAISRPTHYHLVFHSFMGR